MRVEWTRPVHRFLFVALAALASTTTAAWSYNLGGVSCAAAPSNFDVYCFGGFGLTPYQSAVANPANFGGGGTVPAEVTTTALSSFTPAALAGVDGIVVPWWFDADAGANVDAVKAFFLAGGDLFILADDSSHDPVNAALGLATIDTAGSATFKATSGNAPLYVGPFGGAATVNQFLSIGRLDPAAVLLRNGRIVGSDAAGNVVAAVWERNDYAPGAGRLVIVTDVDMIVEGSGWTTTYAPPNDNGRFALNATAFLVAGGAIDGFAYDLVGVPSCAMTPGGFDFYCGRSDGFGVTRDLNLALTDPANFGPSGTVPRRAAIAPFDAFTPQLAARLKAVIVPWVADADATPYAPALRDWFLAGGNLWLLQDDPFHDPVGALLGIPTPTAIGVGSPRPTNGVVPAYDGPFGTASDVGQILNVGALNPSDVATNGGTVVGTANATGEAVVAAWQEGDYEPGAGRMVIATDVDAIVLGLFAPQEPNRRWMLNIMAFLLGDHDEIAPTVTCAASPGQLWPPNGKSVNVTVAGTITDVGRGVDPANVTFTVEDEYGQPQPSGDVTPGAGGAYSIAVPLVAARNDADRDGRRYSVVVRAADLAGNVGSCSAVVTVPHDGRN